MNNKLQSKMIDDMQLCDYSDRTQKSYLRSVQQLINFWNQPPEEVSEQQVREYFLFCKNDLSWSASTMRGAYSGIKFFYLQHVLPHGFTKVRHYGFLAPNCRVPLQRIRELICALYELIIDRCLKRNRTVNPGPVKAVAASSTGANLSPFREGADKNSTAGTQRACERGSGQSTPESLSVSCLHKKTAAHRSARNHQKSAKQRKHPAQKASVTRSLNDKPLRTGVLWRASSPARYRFNTTD